MFAPAIGAPAETTRGECQHCKGPRVFFKATNTLNGSLAEWVCLVCRKPSGKFTEVSR